MRFSQAFIPTLRESPAEAETVAHQLMLRAGMIRKLAAGIYDWLPAGLRVLKRVEQIVREEMNAVGGLEVWLPQLQPRELWEETGRWGVYGKELMRLKDRKNSDFCLAPTAEEVITDLVRREVRSYRNLPLMLYQFGVKYRDEIRPRFGVMRAREFYMKDAYSFHTDDEFMVLADTGEEGIVSSSCGYAANVERAELAPSKTPHLDKVPKHEEVSTPKATSVDDVAKLLNRPANQFIKALILKADDQPIMVLVRGDHELNEIKLQRYLKAGWVAKADEATYEKATGSPVGFAGPVRANGVRILADYAVEGISDAVVGANKKDAHMIHVVPGRDFKPEAYADLRKAVAGDPCPRCGEPMEISRGIEVGHTFQLGTKYSAAMKATYLDPKGESHPIVMGCYGIGVSRVVAACIEQCHDANGIVWPESLAPWDLIIIPLNVSKPDVKNAAESLYAEAQKAGLQVLLDDRDMQAGAKLKDADLIGIPKRIVVGERKIAEGKVEFKRRQDKESRDIPLSDALSLVLQPA